MAKYLKEVLKGVKSSTKVTNDLGGYKPKAGDEEDFAKKHEIEKHADRVGNGDDVYKGKTKHVLANTKEKNHGYKKPEDAKVNEEQIDEISAKTALKTAVKRQAGAHGAAIERGDELSDKEQHKVNRSQSLIKNKYGQRGSNIVDRAVGKKIGYNEEVESIEELSTDLLHRAAHKAAKKAMTDVQGRSGPIFKKRAAQANKFRDKGMAQEKKEKAVKEAYDDNSSNVSDWTDKKLKWHKEKQSSSSAKAHSELVRRSKTGQAAKSVKEEVVDEAYGSNAGKTATGTKWSDSSVSVSVHHDGKKHTFTGKHDYVAKKLKDAHGIGMHQVNFKKASDIKEAEQVDELSKTTLGNYAHAGVRDIASRQYALGKGDKSNTGKLMNRRKGVDKAISKLSKEETVEEGAKVDRMISHIKSSEKSAGKSDKKAENIAWATANKRGMLDNKKKKVEESDTPITFPNKQSNNAVGQNV